MRCECLETKEIYRDGWTRLRRDVVRYSNGVEAVFAVVERKGGASVLPITEDGRVVLVREYKYPLDAYSLEIVSGGIEEGEDPLATAQRELAEEVGLTATTWTSLGFVHALSTAIRAPVHLFLARGLTSCATKPDDTEFLERVEMTLAEALRLVETGGITNAAACVTILRAARKAGL